MTLRFGLIGYGEVGQIFARDLLKNRDVQVATFDRLFRTQPAALRIEQAGPLGVRIATSLADAVRGADVVISAVTADQASAVAVSAAECLTEDQIFVDVNSASPNTKIAAAVAVDATGAHFIEAAVMATVPGPGLGVPILGGGAKAVDVAAMLNPLGMNITPVSDTVGKASAMKLCRSIMIKGIEALIIQCKDASDQWDVVDPVFASLQNSYPGIDWPELAIAMRARVNAHGIRRSAEMREAGEMVRALGMDDSLCNGIADVQAANAGK